MLTTAGSLRALAESHPALKEAKGLIEHEWSPDAPPPTVVSSELAKALLSKADTATGEGLRLVFACVERILSEGDDVAKDVVATGFLEAIVAASDTARPGAARLGDFLGPLWL